MNRLTEEGFFPLIYAIITSMIGFRKRFIPLQTDRPGKIVGKEARILLLYTASLVAIGLVIPANPGSESGAGAGIQKRTGFPRVKHGAGLVKPGMTNDTRLMSLCIIFKVILSALSIKPIPSLISLLSLCLLLSLTLWLFQGCTSSVQEKSSSLTIAMESSPTNLDPRLATDANSSQIIQLIFSSLVEKDPRGYFIPDLAEKWESPDLQTYIFHVRHQAKFHNGEEVTGEDVKYTFNSILNPAFRSPHRGSFENIQSIEVLDKYRVKFILKEPFSPFLTTMSIGIVPRREAERAGRDFASHPVGSGPFQLEYAEPDSKFELKAFPDYFGGKAKLDRLSLRIIPDQTIKVLELEKGGVDFIQNDFPPDLLPRFQNDKKLKIVRAEGTSYSYLGFNLEDPILKKRKVREAIALSLNREEIIENILKGMAKPATGLLAPSNWAYNGQVPVYDHSPDRARQLLDEAGYADPDGDGPLPRFTLNFKTSQNELRRRIAEVIQRQLGLVGIRMEIKSYEWGTFFADIQKGNFQVYTLTWVGVTDPDIYYYVFHSHSFPPHGANRGRYSKTAIDQLLEEGRKTLDLDRRREIYGEVQKIIARDLPYVSLWYSTNVAIMKKSVMGFTLYPSGDFTSFKDVYIDRY